ncbi:MAG TPA: hypothetical protein VL947_08580, partial [Cytophagales bacterium]|nr:hypothetical protein [Cytophagales bacterium]
MKKLTLLSLLLNAALVYCQNVQWAYKVLGFSSEKSNRKNSAQQVLGKPNVLPSTGENIHAWQPTGKLKEEYIKVGFLTPVKPKQIIIAESHNPGYVSKVYVYDVQGKEHLVHSYKPKAAGLPGQIFSVSTSDLKLSVAAVKVVITPAKGILVGIDAIGISESSQPFDIKVSQSDFVKSNMVATKLGTSVNSPYPEFGPLLSSDGRTLYFSRRGDPKNVGGEKDEEDIWYAAWDSKAKKWKEAQNIGKPLNNKEPNFINSITPDGNTILLGNTYLPDGTMGAGASVSYRTASGWTTPQNLLIDQEENVNEKANYFLSNTKKVIVLSIEQKNDTQGDRDIYVSFLGKDTIWSKPLNLGKTVNTSGTEAAPFLAADEQTLYFTSNGLGGYGGSDIYVTRRLDDSWTKWSTPENLGPVVNTPYDESFLSISASGNKVFFTSNGDKEGDLDMYTLTLPSMLRPLPVVLIKGRVLNTKTKDPVPNVRIFFENLNTGNEVGVAISSDETGEYQIILPSGSSYGYLAERRGYASVNSNMDLTKLTEYAEIEQDLFITPLEV